MYLERLLYPVTALGPGSRVAIWVSGCNRHCNNCTNPELWERKEYQKITSKKLIGAINSVIGHNVDGITITGGEPFDQATELCKVIDGLPETIDVLKNINIPKPDYRMRGQIINSYASTFPGYSNATPDEQKIFNDTFVGSSEGFSTQDIARVFQIARMNNQDIRSINKAIMLYKHGVQDNPWLKLDVKRLAEAEDFVKRRVLGQDPVVKSAVDIVKRAAMGMSGLQHSGSSSKPRGILFFAGPTGTGKTELAKALTELVFLDERNMIRFDMSEYRQEQSDQRLLGAPPGYVGYEAGGQLTNAVREHPFSVLLFDEIEKAHPSIMDKFLQILEDGRITDGRGETVYFQDCLIIFTSNLGITMPSPENPSMHMQNVSYENDKDYETVREKVLTGVKYYFNNELGRPELLNRIGNNILVYNTNRRRKVSTFNTGEKCSGNV